jgi:hypothetical protein
VSLILLLKQLAGKLLSSLLPLSKGLRFKIVLPKWKMMMMRRMNLNLMYPTSSETRIQGTLFTSGNLKASLKSGKWERTRFLRRTLRREFVILITWEMS